ncbi:MAG: hypothetical protein GXN97_04390, partial [Aquificae bacterium]|nr:hypothetical protein [Aquificota bacterium]
KENFDISSLKDYIKYAWKWNGSNWEIYIPDNYPDLIKKAKEYGLSFFTEVKPLEGVWIYSNYDLDIEGGFSYGNYTLNLKNTWNLVGNPSFADLNFTDLYKSSNFTIAWVWNVNNQKWEVFIPPDNKELIEVAKKYNISLISSLNGTDYKGFWLKK